MAPQHRNFCRAAVAAVGPFVMWNVLVWRQPAIMVVFGSVGKKHKQQYNHDEL